MSDNITKYNKRRTRITRLHWRLFVPLVTLLWLIIAISFGYSVSHEKQRQKYNLDNRLLNVNNTVIDAYNRGVNLQSTVDFIRLFTDNTTLAPLRITVYDRDGIMIADNPEATILLRDSVGNIDTDLLTLMRENSNTASDIRYGDETFMVCAKMSPDSMIYSLAALPYEGVVTDFLSADPTRWLVIILLGLFASVIAFFSVGAMCRNVYALRDFADDIADDRLPDNIDTTRFSNDELGDVSRHLLTLYRDKIHAEQEKIHHEHQIAMNISHELNTPVSIIKGYIDSVVGDPEMPSEMRHKFLTRIQQNTDRLASLVADVSMVMRLADGNATVKDCSVINFRQLTERLAEDIAQGHIAEGMTFTCNVPAGCLVYAHESLLLNALLNLIYNAARHSGGTRISLDWVGERDGYQVFTFADDGTGVDDKHLGRLFDLFYRVDTGRSRKNGGSGLGLPLVQRIITAMGGEITVSNLPTGGLSFTFTLPTPQS